MLRRHLVALAAVIAVTLALPAQAQWKWLDSRGQTQYSDLPPPPGTPERSILHRPGGAAAQASRTALPASAAPAASAASAAALAPKIVEPELEAKRKQAEQQAAQQAAAKQKADEARIAAGRAENCSRAKAQMRTLDSGIRIARVNEKGEREILDDAARAAEAKRSRDIIASDCS